MINPDWLAEFDSACQELWGLGIHALNTDEDLITEYMNLDPSEAALVYGEDMGLPRKATTAQPRFFKRLGK